MVTQGTDSPGGSKTAALESPYYWGKANPSFAASGAEWHPLQFHSLDVAAVGEAYLGAHRSLLNFFAAGLGVSPEMARRWTCFLLSIHDLGKFSTAFQNLRPDLLLKLQGRESRLAYTLRHDSLGDYVWKDALLSRHDVLGLGAMHRAWRSDLSPWVAAVTGHHGQPPGTRPFHRDEHFTVADEKQAAAFVTAARDMFLPGDDLDQILAAGPERLGHAGRRLSWWLAGVAVLSDWVGSDTRHFPYCIESLSLGEYWPLAQERARGALAASGLLPAVSAPESSIAALFGWDALGPPSRKTTPLQDWAEHVELPAEPQLYLLEDVTGSGKTEAALVLAHRLMAAGHADGIFMGLPTMATTDAMYERLAKMSSNLFEDAGKASLTLAHSRGALVRTFRESIEPGAQVEADARQTDETASARCAAWLADNNKKSLLANVGVGTVDQALLSILHAKHQSLRLLGLFRKVLIVDEVHACDAYMQRLLEALLEFHAAAGGSAVLLSATLPMGTKQALARAFVKGTQGPKPVLAAQDYPLATRISSSEALEKPLGTRPEVSRSVEVLYLDSRSQVIELIRAALAAKRCVCWIRNTVADAIDAWKELSTEVAPENIILFHARFTLADRLALEEEVLRCFGPESGPAQRRGRLVIATQVIEQSLDVDFDLLISDLAPIDRLVQRAGRLQRHVRDAEGARKSGEDERGGARILVFGPAWTQSPSADWYSSLFRGGSFVYPHAGQLWATAQLMQRGGWRTPDDGRDLIEAVFGEEAQDRFPKSLQKQSETVEGLQWAAINLAAANHLKLDTGYLRGNVGDWWDDDAAPASAALDEWGGDAAATRLSEKTTMVRLARWKEGRLVPWNSDSLQAWEASALRLPARLLSRLDVPDAVRLEIERIAEQLPDRGKWSMVIPLRQESDGWMLDFRDSADNRRKWRYSRSGGLQFD